MNKENFIQEWNEMKIKYPKILKSRSLLIFRTVSTLIVLCIIQLITTSLPFYHIKCMQDKYMNYLNSYKKNDFLNLTLLLIFCIFILLNIIITFTHWFKKSNNFKLPICYVLFFSFKFFIDLILKVSNPIDKEYFIIKGYKIKYNNYFYSNVDTYIGLCLISFSYYIFMNCKKLKKILLILYSIFTIIFSINFLMYYKLSYSYSIITSFFVYLFCDILSIDLNKKINLKYLEYDNIGI